MALITGSSRTGLSTHRLEAAGLRLRERVDDWGGGMFLLVFERAERNT